ncbi:MAG: S8/S53 family peptidase [Oscillospiraceae bacterium]|nr:S8/S53 family peptidase [Oscillospiraceae bacterium]
MGKKNQKLAIMVALVVASTFTGCSNKTAEQSESVAEVKQANATEEKKYVSHLTENGEGIAIVREKDDWTEDDDRKEPLTEMLQYKPEDPYAVDLRSRDVSVLDLTNEMENLKYASFDSKTKWPSADKMPADFDPEKIMENGKNPGLGIRALHGQGITGKGVGIAIIDHPLLVDHAEYKNNLKLYEEIGVVDVYDKVEDEHGPAVASLAVGKTCGVAKDADLYFIGCTKFSDDIVCANTCKCIDRILEINEKLPADRKIRVISISRGYEPEYKDFDKLEAKIKEAEEKGVFVLTTGPSAFISQKNISFMGLDRIDLNKVESSADYTTAVWYTGAYTENEDLFSPATLLVPEGNRTHANCQGQHLYGYDSVGGKSWATPYFAGCYALACQVYPQITPNQFFELAIKTGDILNDTPENTRKDKENARIINMAKLIEELKKL